MAKKSKNDRVTWEVKTLEDKETGDLILPIPQELLDRLGWREGDTLDWKQDPQGRWILSKR